MRPGDLPSQGVSDGDVWFVRHEVQDNFPVTLEGSTVGGSPANTTVSHVDISSAIICERI